MNDADLSADYLVVGSGAVGLAFADVIVREDPDATLVIVDRHAAPGGHWNDAYPFVRLHQPSAFYGIEGLELGQDRIDDSGPNSGFYELAGHGELLAYFERAMGQLVETGRVTYFPLSDYRGDGRFVQMLSGEEVEVDIRRRLVDSTYFDTSVPATHTPKFSIAEGTPFVAPHQLPERLCRGKAPSHFVILGGGKTAMDVGVWLLTHGVGADQLSWVRPRDSWLINRRYTQPGIEFFEGSIGFQAALMKAAMAADTPEAFFLELEKGGHMLRIDPEVDPTKFFFATISEGEVALLRTIDNVLRGHHVTAIAPGRIEAGGETHTVADDALYIDCTASAVADKEAIPIFQDDRIVPQALIAPLVTHSAAVAAWLEVHRDDDGVRNALAQPIAVRQGMASYLTAVLGNMTNRMRWAREPDLSDWLANSRLDPTARTARKVAAEAPEKMKIVSEFRDVAKAGVPALMGLIQSAREA